MMFESLEDRRLFAVELPVVPPVAENANPVGVAAAAAGAENGETASTQGQAGTRGTTISALARGDNGGGAD